MSAELPEPDIVKLKLQGKTYKCVCRSKKFRLTSGILPGTLPRYCCAFCLHPVDPDRDFEEQLPPRNDWRTPGSTALRPAPADNSPDLWGQLHLEYRFNLDVAADAVNTKCLVWFDGLAPESDALKCDWFGHDLINRQAVICDAYNHLLGRLGLFRSLPLPEDVSAWMNSPYQPIGTIETWLTKALEQAALGVRCVCLVPMSSSVGWFNDLVVPFAEWQTFKGRIPFEDPLATSTTARTNPKQDNLLVIYNPNSTILGHTAVRDARTGKRLWSRPDTVQ